MTTRTQLRKAMHVIAGDIEHGMMPSLGFRHELKKDRPNALGDEARAGAEVAKRMRALVSGPTERQCRAVLDAATRGYTTGKTTGRAQGFFDALEGYKQDDKSAQYVEGMRVGLLVRAVLLGEGAAS